MNQLAPSFKYAVLFNGFCKKALKCEASNAHRDMKRYQKHFVSFSDLTPEKKISFTRLTINPTAKITTILFVWAVKESRPNC